MTLETRKGASKVVSDSAGASGSSTRGPNHRQSTGGQGHLDIKPGPGGIGTIGSEISSPTYVSINVAEGIKSSSNENSMGSNPGTTGSGTATYVTYTTTTAPAVGSAGSGEVDSLHSITTTRTTTISTPDGQTITYPVYAIGEGVGTGGGNSIYGPTVGVHGSHLAYSTGAHSSGTGTGLAYAQENGVTYLVQTTDSSGNLSSGMDTTNTNGEIHLTTPVTRVSPVTLMAEEFGEIVVVIPEGYPKPLSGSSSIPVLNYEAFKAAKKLEQKTSNQSKSRKRKSVCAALLKEAQSELPVEFEENTHNFLKEMATKKIINSDDETLGTSLTSILTPSLISVVQWLLDNFETAEGVSLPRFTLYHHYIRHCVEHKLDPVNAASFGKLIRSVFLGLRTRRLGTRGNSKYHYYGIRMKPDSPLNSIDVGEESTISGSSQSNGRLLGSGIKNGGSGSGIGNLGPSAKRFKNSRSSGGIGSSAFESGDLSSVVTNVDSVTIQHYLGDSSQVMESLPQLIIDSTTSLPGGITREDIKIFGGLYLEHCGNLLTDVMHFQLVDFQRHWRSFWRAVGENENPSHLVQQNQYEAQLSKEKLQLICGIKEIQDYVQHTDYEFYQCLTNVLLPEVLRPIPGPMTTTIRNFAKAIENCLGAAMTGYPDDMINTKLTVLGAFSQTLRRYTSLNHLAQAARAVLQNESQINQMINDLNRVDFHPLEDQARWICGCPAEVFSEIEEEFKVTLAQHQGLEEWAGWLERTVDRVLRPYSRNTERFSVVARQFLMAWSLYSSLVIRDLTLRSAASFGSFHLLRLLYDEYLFFIIENRVARAMGVTPISLLGRKTNPAFDESRELQEAEGEEEEEELEDQDVNSAPESS